jgi:hypothetical protein
MDVIYRKGYVGMYTYVYIYVPVFCSVVCGFSCHDDDGDGLDKESPFSPITQTIIVLCCQKKNKQTSLRKKTS